MSEESREERPVVELKIDKLVAGGKGLGRYQNKVYFVKYAAPSEIVRVEVIKEKRDYAEGRLLEVLIPSSARVEPLCPYFGVCGGCQLQHIAYEEQVRQKVEIFKEQLQRVGKIRELPPVEAVPSPQPYGYRVRAQFHVEAGRLGFVEDETLRELKGRGEIVDIDTCPILHPRINELIPHLKRVSAEYGSLREVHVTYSPNRDEALIKLISEEPLSEGDLRRIKEELLPPFVVGVGDYKRVLRELVRRNFYGRDYTFISAKGFTYRVSAESFVQNNYLLWDRFIELVVPGERRGYCLDTFCGIGFFTIPFSEKAFFVEGSDMNNFAIADANYNARLNDRPNVAFLRATPSEHMKRHLDKEVDTVIFDPPRSGLDKRDLKVLRELLPDRIVYVSCNPSTLARDLGQILRWGVYRYKKAVVIDLFPQTAHIESVNYLEKIPAEGGL
ncbi:MAG: class I SAM-dependent RNA methyltransferase [Aquificae bacterium]|nr:class I SAM-dependent RNA methyltransferase [Aquificota bacterium]